MTEKRFAGEFDNQYSGVYDDGEQLSNFEVVRLLNDYEKEIVKLKQKNKELEELVREVDNELEIRDIVCGAGKFRLEEWGKHRYHQFYKGDEELEDETVVIMLMELEKENKELQEFKDKVFNSIDKTIEDETQIAENIESTIEGDYMKAVNRLTIITFENLKKELSE